MATTSTWTNQETTNLIHAYQDKSHSLKKVPLKSSQWEEVAVTVAARCGYDEPSKTATQCRHKMEKLRLRYRAEVQLHRPSFWSYFHLMDRVVLDPRPISARPATTIEVQNLDGDEDSNDERTNSKSKTMNSLLRTPLVVNRKWNSVASVTVTEAAPGVIHNHREAIDSRPLMVGAEREEICGYLRLADEIRAYAEKYVKMENMKMEMMREIERYRMEMEDRRTETILDSRRRIVDRIGKALGSHKKIKIDVNNH